jgi:hypothetical protein
VVLYKYKEVKELDIIIKALTILWLIVQIAAKLREPKPKRKSKRRK